MVMKKFAQDVFTIAIIRDLEEAKMEEGYIHTTEYGATVLMCDPKTVSNLLETGKWTSVHFDLMLKNTKAVNLRKLFLTIGQNK